MDTNRAGLLYGLAAYIFWGVAPVYFMLVSFASPFEVIAHRVIWSVLLLAIIVTLLRNWRELRILKREQWIGLAISGFLLSINWLTFVWALFNDQMLETSLGYYINPLFTVFLGVVVLKEQPSRLQWMALGLAATAVAYELMALGRIPWVALILTASFGLYGLVRKQIAVGSLGGLLVEAGWMLPFACIYLFWQFGEGAGTLFGGNHTQLGLLGLGGLVTIFPLACFAAAAVRLELTTLGFLQYLAPTITFVLAILIYDQNLRDGALFTFVLIWTALFVFSIDGWRNRRRYRVA